MKLYLLKWIYGQWESGFLQYVIMDSRILPTYFKVIAELNLPQSYKGIGALYKNKKLRLLDISGGGHSSLSKKDARYKKAKAIFDNIDAYELLSP
jgi:hypothetical protein